MSDTAQKETVNTTRHEVILVNGIVISVVMSLVGIFFVVGIGLWLHNISLFRLEKAHTDEMSELYMAIRTKKNIIIEAEGSASWAETIYVKTHGNDNSAAVGLAPH